MTLGLWLALVQWVIVTYAFPLVVIAIALDTSPLGSFAEWPWRVQLAFLTISKDLGEIVDIGCVALVTFQHTLDWLGIGATLHPSISDLIELGTRIVSRPSELFATAFRRNKGK